MKRKDGFRVVEFQNPIPPLVACTGAKPTAPLSGRISKSTRCTGAKTGVGNRINKLAAGAGDEANAANDLPGS